MSGSTRWTQESALRFKYQPKLDQGARGNHYLWEGGTGFGMRLYRTGRRTWVCATTVTDKEASRQIPRFFTVGLVGVMPLKDARIAATQKLDAMRSGVDPRQAEKAEHEAEDQKKSLARVTFEKAMNFYVENRNCAPISKDSMVSTLRANAADWMQKSLFDITSIMLQERYRYVMQRVRAQGEKFERQWAALPPHEQLLHASPGYWTGEKAALDTIKSFTRVYRYWTRKHLDQLQRAGIVVPVCPSMALVDDLLPERERVKSIPIGDLCKLVDSFATYQGNALHPLLFRLLLATGRRIGVVISIRMKYILEDRIVIPANAERSKVPWRKRHMEHLDIVIPITPIVRQILDEIKEVAYLYGDSETWLFPSRTSKKHGHMCEERSMTERLRAHANVRFNPHQLRHNFATVAEELGYEEAQIGSLLGHGKKKVTARYIDERVKRHCRQMTEISAKIEELMNEARAAAEYREARVNAPPPSELRAA